MRPYISSVLCTRCLECIDICPYEVFAYTEGSVVAAVPEDCIECTSCVEMCPHKAIRMDD